MNESQIVGNSSDEELLINYHMSREFKFRILSEYYPVAYNIELYLPFVVYIVGFFGNSISAVVWLQQKLRKNNSSAIYLALLSINDLVYLILHCIDFLGRKFVWKQSFLPLYCEVYMYFNFILQYMSPLFVLGFTGERFIAVCYPLRRRLWCRTRTAKWCIATATLFVAIMSAVHPLFWTNDVKVGYCGLRPSIPGLSRVWFLFSTITESIFFIAIPILVLVLDLIVVVMLCRIRSEGRCPKHETVTLTTLCSDEGNRKEAGKHEGHNLESHNKEIMNRSMSVKVPAQATTALILTVSLYEAISLMALSIVYLLSDSYPRGDPKMTEDMMMTDPTWLSYFRFTAMTCIVIPLCMTRHASLIFFFLAIGRRFRETLFDLLRCRRWSSSHEQNSGTPTSLTRNVWMSCSQTSNTSLKATPA